MRNLAMVALALTLAGVPARAQERDGRFLFQAHCAECHGHDARGDGVDADLFSPPPANLRAGILSRYPEDVLVERIRHGRPLTLGRDPERLRARAGDTEMLIAHLRRLSTLPWRRLERGQEIYVDRCEVCHGAFGHPSTVVGRGVDKPPRDLSDPAYQRRTPDATLLEQARHGFRRMPAIDGLEVDENRQALLAYLRLLSPGYEHYSRFCAGCHGDDGRGPGVDWASSPRPHVVFDDAYFAKKDPEALRRNVWHMLDDNQPQMPHMSRVLTPRDVRLILTYLRGLPPH